MPFLTTGGYQSHSNCTTPLLQVFTFINGVLSDIAVLEFQIFDVTTPTNQLNPVQVYPAVAADRASVDVSSACPTGQKLGTGNYVAPYDMPGNLSTGTYQIRWFIQETTGGRVWEYREEFEAVSPYVYGEAAVSASASVNPVPTRIAVGVAPVSASASAQPLGNVIYSGEATPLATADVDTADPNLRLGCSSFPVATATATAEPLLVKAVRATVYAIALRQNARGVNIVSGAGTARAIAVAGRIRRIIAGQSSRRDTSFPRATASFIGRGRTFFPDGSEKPDNAACNGWVSVGALAGYGVPAPPNTPRDGLIWRDCSGNFYNYYGDYTNVCDEMFGPGTGGAWILVGCGYTAQNGGTGVVGSAGTQGATGGEPFSGIYATAEFASDSDSYPADIYEYDEGAEPTVARPPAILEGEAFRHVYHTQITAIATIYRVGHAEGTRAGAQISFAAGQRVKVGGANITGFAFAESAAEFPRQGYAQVSAGATASAIGNVSHTGQLRPVVSAVGNAQVVRPAVADISAGASTAAEGDAPRLGYVNAAAQCTISATANVHYNSPSAQVSALCTISAPTTVAKFGASSKTASAVLAAFTSVLHPVSASVTISVTASALGGILHKADGSALFIVSGFAISRGSISSRFMASIAANAQAMATARVLTTHRAASSVRGTARFGAFPEVTESPGPPEGTRFDYEISSSMEDIIF